MASAVHIATAACTDVLAEPFNNLTAWTPSAPAPDIVAGRTGNAVELNFTGARADYLIATPNQSDTVTVGFAYRAPTLTASNRYICEYYSDSNATFHCALRLDGSTGQLNFYRGGATIVASSATGLIAVNTWYYLEVQVKLHDTAGFVIVRRNGTDVINATALDTKNSGTKTVFDAFHVYMGVISNKAQYDDLYLSTGSGCTFKGDHTIP